MDEFCTIDETVCSSLLTFPSQVLVDTVAGSRNSYSDVTLCKFKNVPEENLVPTLDVNLEQPRNVPNHYSTTTSFSNNSNKPPFKSYRNLEGIQDLETSTNKTNMSTSSETDNMKVCFKSPRKKLKKISSVVSIQDFGELEKHEAITESAKFLDLDGQMVNTGTSSLVNSKTYQFSSFDATIVGFDEDDEELFKILDASSKERYDNSNTNSMETDSQSEFFNQGFTNELNQEKKLNLKNVSIGNGQDLSVTDEHEAVINPGHNHSDKTMLPNDVPKPFPNSQCFLSNLVIVPHKVISQMYTRKSKNTDSTSLRHTDPSPLGHPGSSPSGHPGSSPSGHPGSSPSGDPGSSYLHGSSPSSLRSSSPSSLRRSSPSSLRDSSPSSLRDSSPYLLRDTSPSLLRDTSPSLLRCTSPSLLRDTSPSLLRDTSPSLLRDTSPSLLRDTSPSLLRGFSPSLLRGPSPFLLRGPSPSLLRGPSPSLLRGPSPSLLRGPSPSLLRGPSPSSLRVPSPSLLRAPSPYSLGHPGPSSLRCPSPSLLRNPGPLSLGYPGPSVFGHSGPSVFGHSGPSVLGHPGPSVLGHPGPSVLGHPGPSVLGHPGPSVLGHTGPSVLGHTGPSVLGHPGPSVLGHPGPSLIGHTGASLLGYPDPSSMGHTDPSSLGDTDPSLLGHPDPSSLGHPDPSSLGHPDPSSLGHPDPSSLGHPDPSSSGHPVPSSSSGHPDPSSLRYLPSIVPARSSPTGYYMTSNQTYHPVYMTEQGSYSYFGKKENLVGFKRLPDIKECLTSAKRARSFFSVEQQKILNRRFAQSHYVQKNQVAELASLIKVPAIQIRIWFQNRRTKYKKLLRSSSFQFSQKIQDNNYQRSVIMQDIQDSSKRETDEKMVDSRENYTKRLIMNPQKAENCTYNPREPGTTFVKKNNTGTFFKQSESEVMKSKSNQNAFSASLRKFNIWSRPPTMATDTSHDKMNTSREMKNESFEDDSGSSEDANLSSECIILSSNPTIKTQNGNDLASKCVSNVTGAISIKSNLFSRNIPVQNNTTVKIIPRNVALNTSVMNLGTKTVHSNSLVNQQNHLRSIPTNTVSSNTGQKSFILKPIMQPRHIGPRFVKIAPAKTSTSHLSTGSRNVKKNSQIKKIFYPNVSINPHVRMPLNNVIQTKRIVLNRKNVRTVLGNNLVKNMSGNNLVKNMSGNNIVRNVSGNNLVKNMSGNDIVNNSKLRDTSLAIDTNLNDLLSSSSSNIISDLLVVHSPNKLDGAIESILDDREKNVSEIQNSDIREYTNEVNPDNKSEVLLTSTALNMPNDSELSESSRYSDIFPKNIEHSPIQDTTESNVDNLINNTFLSLVHNTIQGESHDLFDDFMNP